MKRRVKTPRIFRLQRRFILIKPLVPFFQHSLEPTIVAIVNCFMIARIANPTTHLAFPHGSVQPTTMHHYKVRLLSVDEPHPNRRSEPAGLFRE